jgi:Uma2 family endonuclease
MSPAVVRPGPTSPSAVPVGPSVERWQAMSAIERERFFADVFAAFDVPAQAMTEGRPHRRAKSAALDALTLHFRSTGRTIYMADELAVVYPGEPVFCPDLLAVLDVPQPDPDEDERMAWVVADEGKGPDLLLEVLHQGNREKDLVNNVQDYARLGVHEYFVYDRLRFRLHGYRLARPGAGYQELRPRLGRLSSEVLGLDLALVGRRLRFFSGMAELPNSEEFIERLSKMMDGIEARAQQAEAQAQQAEAQAQQAEAQAQQAEVQAQQAEAQIRDAVLDLAEAYGLEITPERRQQVRQASLGDLAALRAALKAGRSWP